MFDTKFDKKFVPSKELIQFFTEPSDDDLVWIILKITNFSFVLLSVIRMMQCFVTFVKTATIGRVSYNVATAQSFTNSSLKSLQT